MSGFKYLVAVVLAAATMLTAPATAFADLDVVVTIKPIHSLVARLMTGIGTPKLLVDGSASPHAFSLKPSHSRAINNADVFIRVSATVEPFTGKIIKSLPETAGPPDVFEAAPELYRLWSEMSQVLMNGPSPLSPGERELILAYAAGVVECAFVYAAHSAVAYAWGIEDGLIEKLLQDLDATPLEPGLKPLLAFVRKLTLTPDEMTQAGLQG